VESKCLFVITIKAVATGACFVFVDLWTLINFLRHHDFLVGGPQLPNTCVLRAAKAILTAD
jgi:hypothetical protein